MFIACRDYLIKCLEESGIRTPPIKTMKQLETTQDPRVGAVIFASETFRRSGSKRTYRDENGARHKRRKVFDRDTTFNVIIGDPEPERAERIFERFVCALDNGIVVDGNFVSLEPGQVEWVTNEDSILRSKMAVNIAITFYGGVYSDTRLGRLTGIDIQVEKEEA
ncbi:SON protein [Oscillospiraceae bacterium OttesenSCG-928-F05]|nr:SON protein [Oscillospiraceae bacterium OttesenSCG-928-F05]